MTRFFFDVKSGNSVEYDYGGKYFRDLGQAEQMAELIAMDVGCTRVDGSSLMEVEIRDAKGCLLVSVPIQFADALAA